MFFAWCINWSYSYARWNLDCKEYQNSRGDLWWRREYLDSTRASEDKSTPEHYVLHLVQIALPEPHQHHWGEGQHHTHEQCQGYSAAPLDINESGAQLTTSDPIQQAFQKLAGTLSFQYFLCSWWTMKCSNHSLTFILDSIIDVLRAMVLVCFDKQSDNVFMNARKHQDFISSLVPGDLFNAREGKLQPQLLIKRKTEDDWGCDKTFFTGKSRTHRREPNSIRCDLSKLFGDNFNSIFVTPNNRLLVSHLLPGIPHFILEVLNILKVLVRLLFVFGRRLQPGTVTSSVITTLLLAIIIIIIFGVY